MSLERNQVQPTGSATYTRSSPEQPSSVTRYSKEQVSLSTAPTVGTEHLRLSVSPKSCSNRTSELSKGSVFCYTTSGTGSDTSSSRDNISWTVQKHHRSLFSSST